jgi:hypothetical protein
MDCDGPNHVRHGRRGHSKRLCISVKNEAAKAAISNQHGSITLPPPPRVGPFTESLCGVFLAVKSKVRN